MRRARRPHCRGATTIEATMGILVLSLIFMGLAQAVWLYVAQLITYHSSYCTARSYIVGFEPRIVHRAKEISSIGLAGPVLAPGVAVGMTPAELIAIEPELIAEHLQATDGPVLDYQYWPNVIGFGVHGPYYADREARIHVHVWDYPLTFPMVGAYTGREDIYDMHGYARMMNHAMDYLE